MLAILEVLRQLMRVLGRDRRSSGSNSLEEHRVGVKSELEPIVCAREWTK